MTRFTEIEHPSHHHVLVLESAKEPYKCNGCKELGFGSPYVCKHQECNFHLHEECASVDPPPVSHPYLKGCELVFCKESYRKFCDACGKDVLGFSYQCTHKKAHDLHPCCLNLSPTITCDDGTQLRLSNKVLSKCLKCQRKEASNGIKGWCYVSDCGNFCCHVACAKELIVQNFKKGYFNQSTDQMENYLALPSSSTSTALVRRRNGSLFGDTAKMFWKISKMVLKVIISAIFGDPSGVVAILIESLISKVK